MNTLSKKLIIKGLTRPSIARFGGGGGPLPLQLETFSPIAVNAENLYKTLSKRLHYVQVGQQYEKITPARPAYKAFWRKQEENPEDTAVHLYRSQNVANNRKALYDYTALFGVTYFAVFQVKTFFLPFAGYAIYDMFKTYSHEVQRNLVSDLELLPGQRALRFTVPSKWGFKDVKIYALEDLEIVDASNLHPELLADHFWPSSTEIDNRMVFRNKNTDVKFVFDKNGEWDWDVINSKGNVSL